MNNRKLLTNRKWHTNGGWFSTKRFIKENFESIVFCDHIETTSSAGDWTGLIIQKADNKLHIIPFSQENTFPCREGFDIYTGDVTATVQDTSMITNYKEICEKVCDLIFEE
jgi:hypothetical protein